MGQHETPTADEIDSRLHAERLGPGGSKRTHLANLDDLPDGVFVRHPETGTGAYLVRGRRLLAWSAGGYVGRIARPAGVDDSTGAGAPCRRPCSSRRVRKFQPQSGHTSTT